MGGGTPIGMLREDVVEKQARHFEKQAKHIEKQARHIEQQNIDLDDQRQKDEDAIDALINQINIDSDSDESKPKKKKKIKSKKSNDTDTDTDDDKKNIKPEKKSRFKLPFKIPEFVRDPLLIWIIFILLSQNFIKQLIGKYVHQINPNEDGVVSFLGVVIYGLIFAVLFGLVKFLLNVIL